MNISGKFAKYTLRLYKCYTTFAITRFLKYYAQYVNESKIKRIN
jgi:hypothetical protein